MSFVQWLVIVDQSNFTKNYLKTHTQIKTGKSSAPSRILV